MKKHLLLALFALTELLVHAQNKVTVSGYVLDEHSGETLLGAAIRDGESHTGTTTNSFGFYTLTLPKGKVQLDYSYVGYKSEKKVMDLQKDTIVNVRLATDTELPEVVVVSEKDNSGILATGMGIIDIPISQIEHTPALLGETDVIRTLQLMPGVQSGISGSSGLYVRGGNGDENLIMLDGTPIYKVDHLFGFFSVFTPEAMKKVTFYKSSFPARYNGRLSSVVDVRTKDGDMRKFHGTASIGLLTSRLHLEGPIVKDRTSFNFSARTTYIDWLTKPFMEKDSKFSYKFYDINMKLNHRFSDNDRLYLSLYTGKDKIAQDYIDGYSTSSTTYNDKYGDALRWGNAIASLRWNHVFSNKLFANVTASYNHYNMDIDSYVCSSSHQKTENTEATYQSQIKDLSAAIDFDYDPLPQHRVKFGTLYTYHEFSPESSSTKYTARGEEGEGKNESYTSPNKFIYVHEALGYLEDDWSLGSRLTLNMGVSASLFKVQEKSYTTVQPRFSIRYQATKDLTLKASYSEMSQFVHLLTSMPIAMPTDLWVPITNNIEPERSQQYSIGGYYTGWKGWELSVEGYYKGLENILEYKDGLSFMGFSGNWEAMVSMGNGRAFGVEFMLRKTLGNTTGWMAYTLSKSDRKFSVESGVNGGERFPYTYDRRHNLNFVLNHKFSKRFDLDATWMFYSGMAASVPVKKAYLMTLDGITTIDYVHSRNNYRLPSSHTLCLGANFRKTLKGGVERIWNISVYNAYNQMNPTFVYRKNENGESGNNQLVKFTLLPCLPSFTLTYKF